MFLHLLFEGLIYEFTYKTRHALNVRNITSRPLRPHKSFKDLYIFMIYYNLKFAACQLNQRERISTKSMKILYNIHKRLKDKPSNRQKAASTGMPRRKKSLGQNFLRKQSVVDNMIEKVSITPQVSVLEIGCGDGFLTRAILEQTTCKQLWSYEIDPEWAEVVSTTVTDPRLSVKLENILTADFAPLQEHKPWVILANLPYQITFPILFLIKNNKELFQEGVVMVQEEVAQKIVGKSGRGYNQTSLFLQHHFDWQLMEKIEPSAFVPAPKVFSRLLYFKPKTDLVQIPEEEKFWAFLKLCFRSPRQTLRNNIRTTHYSLTSIPEEILTLRAQQMTFDQFLALWKELVSQ